MIQTLRSFCALLLITFISSTTINAQVTGIPGMGKFTLVKTNEEMVGNGRYIIVNVAAGKAMKAYNSGNNNYKQVSVTLTDNNNTATISDTTSAVFNLIKKDNKCKFWENNNGTYMATTTSNDKSSFLKGESDGTNVRTNATILIDENANANIQFKDNNYKYNTLRYNDFSELFSCYEESNTNQKPVRLYREVYTRKVTKGNYGTLCLPYSADLKNGDVSGAEFYAIEGKQMENGEVASISLVEVDTLIRATPYIFLATDDMLEVRYKGYYNKNLVAKSNGLVGSYEATGVAEGMYVISQNQVMKCGKNSKIGTNRCYINMDDVPVTDAPAPGARVLYFNAGTTGIEEVDTEKPHSQQIYDLSGRPVRKPKSGLYIVNGKKIIK